MGTRLEDLPAANILEQDETIEVCQVSLAIRTVTEGNAKEHWRVRHGRSKKQRAETRRSFFGRRVPVLPATVEFVRLSPNAMDDDNLPGALKHVRDEIAALYGVGDSARDPIRWTYTQAKCRRGEFGVRVTIRSAT